MAIFKSFLSEAKNDKAFHAGLKMALSLVKAKNRRYKHYFNVDDDTFE